MSGARVGFGATVALALAVVACEDDAPFAPRGYGTYGIDAGEGATLATRAEAAFRQVEPDLLRLCGKSCHGDNANTGYPWLKGPDPYLAIKAFPGAVTEDPYQSKIYLKGSHAGPALDGANQPVGDKVIAWLVLESTILKSKAIPTTDAFPLVLGANSRDVSKAGKGVDGTKVTFEASRAGNIVTLSKLALAAPGSTAIRGKHPIFFIVPLGKEPRQDPVDSLSTVDIKVGAGLSLPIGTGTMFLLDWVDTHQLKIGFETLEATKVEDAGAPTGGCKSPATFASSAVPALQGNTCLGCHGGANGFATSALDMTQVGKDNAIACAQALNKVNKANKAQSNLILAPTGGGTHPYQIAAAQRQPFIDAVLGWANNE